ncbi:MULTISPECIES: beta-N-acetylhexosaminidase [unclassified Actinotalea]|uniref:beta-N-acetylhexosaminidase n=1 Tax=unclassified Actinotalea TaxID=2638618 RepID=UPI0015F44312|nr:MULTISPECIES: beta-N-acetylhexosaminidase [unclassified Actinotalea]
MPPATTAPDDRAPAADVAPAVPALVPAPVEVATTGEHLVLGPEVRVVLAPELAGARPVLVDVLGRRLGRLVTVVPDGAVDRADGTAATSLVLRHDPTLEPEHHRLEITADGVVVEAGDADGARHAVRTLQQLLGPAAFRAVPLDDAPLVLPGLRLVDGPRFGYRGVLLDVARHFMPKDAVMRFIELASSHKLNVLHLHLTDDQGWRVEIRAFPRLTEVGSWRHESQVGSSRSTLYDGVPHGGYYTQDDLREIVAFAATRGMQVIPEIDVPGHSQAAMAAYPELSAAGLQLDVWTRWGLNPNTLNTSEAVLDFYRAVLDEVLEIFDSPLVSLGGDEVPADQWAANPQIVAQAAELGLDSVEELLPWFVGRLADHLRERGRRVTVWDEVGGSRVPQDVVVNSWRGYRGGIDALRDGHDIVICPEHQVYLDHRAAPGLDEPAPVGTVHTVEDVYRFEPVTDEVAETVAEPGTGQVLGAQAHVWTEQLDGPRRVDFATYPRLCAFAEVVWSPRDHRDYEDFDVRLRTSHLPRLDAAGVEYRPLDGPHPWQRRPGVPGRPLRFDELGHLVVAEHGER